MCKVNGIDILTSVVDGQTKSAGITGQFPATVTYAAYGYSTLVLDTNLKSKI